jgi:hypothetical protein
MTHDINTEKYLEIFRGDQIVVLFYIWNPISIFELLEPVPSVSSGDLGPDVCF